MGKRVIITGASEGLGLAAARKFLSEGWAVVGISRHECPESDVKSIKADLSTEDGIQFSIDSIKAHYSEFDLLINNAGILAIEKLPDIDYKRADTLIKTNLLAPIMLVSKLYDLIIKNNADILNVISTSAYKGRTNWTVYGSSKWGMRGFHENLKQEFDDTTVRVISFNPPAFKSNHFQKAGVDADMKEFLDVEDIADLLFQSATTPKSVQVGEIIINKKKQ